MYRICDPFKQQSPPLSSQAGRFHKIRTLASVLRREGVCYCALWNIIVLFTLHRMSFYLQMEVQFVFRSLFCFFLFVVPDVEILVDYVHLTRAWGRKIKACHLSDFSRVKFKFDTYADDDMGGKRKRRKITVTVSIYFVIT